MILAEYLRSIYVPSRIELSPVYVSHLTAAVNRFSIHLGWPARTRDFSESSLASYLMSYRSLGWSSRSTNNQRQFLLSLWEDAAGHSPPLATAPNRRRIRKLREERDPPEAWTEQQVPDLMHEARCQAGYVGHVLACDWWLSLFDAIYWTSNRISAMLAVESRHYDGGGILVRHQKNHRPQWFPLPASCCEIIDRTEPDTRRLLWEHPWHPRTVWNHARRIIEAAGLPCPRTGRQLFHRLRRTTITLCDRIDQSVAQRTAGHASYETTRAHYVDPRLSRQAMPIDILPDPLLVEHHSSLRIFTG